MERTPFLLALGAFAAGFWMRRHPSACPYTLRFVLRFPRRALARERLLEILTPQFGERVLEIGPGTGYYTLDAANAEAYFDLGESTLTFLLLHGQGRQSGVEVTMPIAQEVRWRGGLCVYFKSHADRDDALRELDVSEEELEPIDPLTDLGLRE